MAAKSAASKWAKVFLFGDSITQRSFSPDGCWGSYLADFLIRRCDVIPRGFSGYNTRGAKAILPGLLTEDVAKEVVAMTIFLGANDASHPEIGKLQHVPVKEYEQNLKDMVEHCLTAGLRREQIIIIAPPAVWSQDWNDYCIKEGKDGVDSRDNKQVELYSKACCNVAGTMGTAFVDLYTQMKKSENYRSYLCDGLHLSESGSRLLFDQLQPIISQLTSHIPDMLYPEWKEISNKDCESAKESLREAGWIA